VLCLGMRCNPDGKLSRAYRKWSSMLQRCYNPRHPAYKYYGGEGHTVCDKWRGKNGFEQFFADMGEPPAGLTLGRINHAEGYSHENCRWETWKEQASNRRKVGPKPDPNSLRQKAIAAGIPYHVVYQRIRAGWNEQRALTAPVAIRSTIALQPL
jgi:hypothetical protein